MAALAQSSLVSVEDYLSGEQLSEIRHEYLGGEAYAMAGASKAHERLALKLGSRMQDHFGSGPCEAFVVGMKVRLRIGLKDIFYYPDVVASCDPRDSDELFLRFPKVIVEVLSKSTARLDKNEKFQHYTTIATLEEYLLVSQERPCVVIHRRRSDWKAETLAGMNETLHLESVSLRLSLATIYENIRLQPEQSSNDEQC